MLSHCQLRFCGDSRLQRAAERKAVAAAGKDGQAALLELSPGTVADQARSAGPSDKPPFFYP